MRILERGYQMIWREDRLEDALIGLDPEFEWVVPGHPEGDVRHGPEATIAFFRDWIEPWDELQVDWELHAADPDRVLAILTMSGRGRESGAPVEMRVGQLWTFKEGRATRMVMYNDVDEALREMVVRRATAAYGSGDYEAVIPYLAEDVVWEEDPGLARRPDLARARRACAASFRERLESTSIEVEIDELVARGNRVLTLMTWTAEGQGSGATGVLRPA